MSNSIGNFPVSILENPSEGPTLWKTVTDILGSKVDAKTKNAVMTATVCFDTPFGKVCVVIDATTASKSKAELEKIYLGEILQDIFSRPRLALGCFEVCVWGVCVKYCD